MARKTPQQRLENIVLRASTWADSERVGWPPGFWDETTVEPWMIEAMRNGEAAMRRFRDELERRLSGEARTCEGPNCRRPVYGRADKTFCSDKCRIQAHRKRRKRATAQATPSP
jgi:hypothetical protein